MKHHVETTQALKSVARQMLLALVVIVAVQQGLNGPLLTIYFVSALLMAGVDAGEIIDGFQFGKLGR